MEPVQGLKKIFRATNILLRCPHFTSLNLKATCTCTYTCTRKKVCAEQTKQTVDSCFGLVGPYQRCVCLAALRWLTYMYLSHRQLQVLHVCTCTCTLLAAPRPSVCSLEPVPSSPPSSVDSAGSLVQVQPSLRLSCVCSTLSPSPSPHFADAVLYSNKWL